MARLPRSFPLAFGLAGLAFAVLSACGRVIDRPLSGAVPGSDRPLPTSAVPPTLAPSDPRFGQLPRPSPGLGLGLPGPSPSASPQPPIIRTIQPPANASLPPGAPVNISAVLVGRGADLVSATLFVDGAEVAAEVEQRDQQQWTIAVTQALPVGPHTARVLVRDTTGAAGGFTWQFTVGEPSPTPPPGRAEPFATPGPSPGPTPRP